METVHIDIPQDHGYLIPLGDLHRGDRHLTARGLGKLKGYLEWVKARPNARIFLMGDILNVASRSSKTSPFESMSGDDEYQKAVELFYPYRSQIEGAISGNHCARMAKEFGFNPLQPFCRELGILYCGYTAALRIRVGKRKDRRNEYRQTYWGFTHHGSGGGSLGAALNRKMKLQEVFHGADFYMAGHDHQLVVGTRNILLPRRDKVEHQRQHFIDTGSFLDWDGSYAEEMALPISKLGAPRIRLSGLPEHHDIHVSIDLATLDKGTHVTVVWDDVEDPPDGKSWLDQEDVDAFPQETTLVESVGWVVSHTEKYLTLCADRIDKLKHYGRVTKITCPQIVRIIEVKEGA